jgi:hypothetical protein
MRRWREKEENYPRTEVRGFGKEYCRVVTRVYPDPLVKLVKIRHNSLVSNRVILQTIKSPAALIMRREEWGMRNIETNIFSMRQLATWGV